MKIALLHYSAPPIVGGVESVMAEHARLMVAAGHEVCILAGRGATFDDRIAYRSIPTLDSRNPLVQRLKADLDRGHFPSAFPDLAYEIQHELEAALAGTDILIAHNVCSLHLNLALTSALFNYTGASSVPRLIQWHHDLAWTTPRYQDELLDGYPWDLLSRHWAWASQVVVSEQRRQELADLYQFPSKKINVIPNGIDPIRFLKLEAQSAEIVSRLKLLNAAPLLLLPVRLTPRKNIELALHVLKELSIHMPGAALLVTGPLGPHNHANVDYFSKLIALRNELGLQGRANFLAEFSDTFLPDAVIFDFYRLADALLLPSREEGFGIPILEAALEGIPVFCADIPPLRSLAGDHAVYFSPHGRPGEIAAEICKVLSNSSVLKLRAQVRSRYTWEQIYREQIAPLLNLEGVIREPS
jgi:glycosyltransferase involved in cell wall biosynthesis